MEVDDDEFKICIICTESCEGSRNDTIDGQSVEVVLHSVFHKLQTPYDDCLSTNLCDVCTKELSVTYRFVKKIEEANLKLRDLLAVEESRDVFSVSPRLGDVIIKFERDNSDGENSAVPEETVEPDNLDCSININQATSEDEEKLKPQRQRLGTKSESQPKRCCGCKFPLTSNAQIEDHSEKRHRRDKNTDQGILEQKPFECSVCFQRFEDKIDFLRHRRTMYAIELYPCKLCPAEFANAYNLRLHVKRSHQRKNTNAQIDEMRLSIHKCCLCRKQFDTLVGAKEHVMENHPLQGDNIDTDNQFECEICSRCFKTPKVLTEHQRRPFRKHRFQCSHCGKTFNERQAFVDHEQSHASVRPYECPICKKRFSLKTNFRTHVRYHSVPDDQFKCEFCGRGFKKKYLLQEHQAIHQENESRPFKCHLCSIAFTRKDLLNYHVKEHLGEKPYKCTQCSASYIHGRDLRRHNRTKHEKSTPFVCDICHNEFGRKDALGKHMKIHRKPLSC
ncbi:zinc finger protein 567-like [Armigeres subalbatus]|uniref:zinc finger protein 567-like n=1 Tax=Armigeres subalbatus TaxID=124917 RepID=UPI002ED4AB7E